MTMIAHHPEEEFLAAYAAGALDLGQHVAIATHLTACAQCRGFVRAMERVGGALIADAPPAALAEGALDRALARLDQPALAETHGGPTPDDAPILLPSFVRTYAFERWRRLAPRVSMRPIPLPASSPTRVFLLKGAAGAKLIEHTHTGLEMTCVLSGAFHQDGQRYGAGDFDYGDGGVRHAPHVDPDEDCVCLVAMQGELRWNGLIGRLIQPFIRL